MKSSLLIASSNRGKLIEFQGILAALPVRLLLPADLGLELDVPETGKTYLENAKLKAMAFAGASGLLTLADDSGLEVAALNGQPGLYSARYSPLPGATDADRRQYLLENLRPFPRPWTARFYCLAAIASPHHEVFFSEGVCPGEIIPEERGTNGFGYDPIFLLPQLGRTMAELDSEVKNRLSHRGRAVTGAIPLIQRLLAA